MPGLFGPRRRHGEPPSAPLPTEPPRRFVADLVREAPASAGALVVLWVVAVADKGAFGRAAALGVGAAALVVLVMSLAARRFALSALWVAAPPIVLAGWWLARAFGDGHPVTFLPLGASLLAFSAALLTTASLDQAARRLAGWVLVGIATAAAGVGLVGLALRVFPLAERAQDLWRVGSTLTYANAAGLLFAMALVVAVGLDSRHPAAGAAIAALGVALVASESRGAVLAIVVASTLVPGACWRRAATPLVLGLLAGLVAVATSRGNQVHLGLLVAVALAVGLAALPGAVRARACLVWVAGRRRLGRPGRVTINALLGLVLAGSVGLLAAGLVTPALRRLNDDRVPEWSGALAEWRSAPVVGVGPDRPIVLQAATKTTAAFAQSDVLQVLADGGLVGGALLGLSVLGAALGLRRQDELASAAVAALVVFGVGGAVDFDWHLPALALCAGWAAGLATRPASPLGAVEVPTDRQGGDCLA